MLSSACFKTVIPASGSGRRGFITSTRKPPKRQQVLVAKGFTSGEAPQDEDPIEDGLTPEEDFVVPGGANDSLSSNTTLGKAVRSASEELEHLSSLEAEVVDEAFDLLKRFGIKVQRPSDWKKECQDGEQKP